MKGTYVLSAMQALVTRTNLKFIQEENIKAEEQHKEQEFFAPDQFLSFHIIEV
jgi:hypothetical protein